MRRYRPSPRLLLDLGLVVAILAVGAWWGAKFERAWRAEGRTSQYYQLYFEPAVMTACGREFSVSVTRPAALHAFLSQQTDAFDCASLPADLPAKTEGLYQFSWYHLMHTVGAAWWIFGVSWSGLNPLFGLLFGTVVALAYGLFRLGMGRPLALLCTFAFGVSTSHLVNLPHLRDYAKAPFVLALILLMAWMVRGPLVRWRLLTLAGVSGLVLGIGYGFRTDLLANIPPLLLTLFFFLPGGAFKNLVLKAQAAAVCLLLFVTMAWPVVAYVADRGGCQWHVTLLGFSSYFDDALAIEPAAYDWGPYSDPFIHTVVGSRFNPHADSDTGPSFCGPEYGRETAIYLGRIVWLFPGDIATRALASMAAVIDVPTRQIEAPLPSYEGPFYLWRGDLLSRLRGYAPLLVLPLLLIVAAVDLRTGLWALGLLLWFGSLPMLQFNIRHHFHLEWIGWFVVGTMASLCWQRISHPISMRWQRRTAKIQDPLPEPPAAASTATAPYLRMLVMIACFVLIAAGVMGARRLQRSTVTSLTASMIEWTSEPVALDRADEGGLMVLRPRLPGSAAARGRFWVEFLRIDVDPRACGAGGTVVVRYHSPRQDSTRFWTIHGDQAAILTPVFVSFSDIAVPSGAAGCIRGVYRAPILKPFPVWMFVDVPADLQRLRAVQSYAGPERVLDLARLLRFAMDSPRAFGRRVADLALDFAWLPWGGPTVYARPDRRIVTRAELRRVGAQVDDSQVGYRAHSASAVGGRWVIQGQSEGPYAYLLVTRQDPKAGRRLLVTGVLTSGGLSVGLIKNNRWIDQAVNVRRLGEFAVVIEPPTGGPYDVIIANNEPDTAKPTHATISAIAWIEPSSEAPERKQP